MYLILLYLALKSYTELPVQRRFTLVIKLLIRFVKLSDLPQIVEIYNQAVAARGATADLEPISIESRESWFHQHGCNTFPIWVAESENAIAGWCCLSPHRPGRKALRHTAEISFYVHEEHQRCGVGSALIAHAIEDCARLNIRNLFTWNLDTNQASAHILEKFNFEEWGRLPNVAEIDGQTCGQVIFGRAV